MSVTIRPYRRGGWEADIQVMLPDGTRHRERRKAPTSSKSGAKRWAEDRERHLLLNGPLPEAKEVPTLGEFAPSFMEGYCKANQLKPSGIASKETILRVHLVPAFGSKRLDQISTEAVQRLKGRLSGKAPKTVNNILTVLNTLLKTAQDWGVIGEVPCRISFLPVPVKEAAYHDFDEFDRLADAADEVDPRTHVIVLLGGEAGLRCGEIMALRQSDIDWDNNALIVQRSDWKGEVTPTKGGRSRRVPMTVRLRAALQGHRHLRGRRVVCEADGSPLTQKVVQGLVRKAADRAGLPNGGVHILRHTFCSHLAMRGAAPRAIQKLAGHADLTTTMRYMHLSPAAMEAAIDLLNAPKPVPRFGDILETGGH